MRQLPTLWHLLVRATDTYQRMEDAQGVEAEQLEHDFDELWACIHAWVWLQRN